MFRGQEVELKEGAGVRVAVVILEIDRERGCAYVEHESGRCEWVQLSNLKS